MARAINLAEGTRPLICRVQTTFHDSPERVPPVVDVQLTRQLGIRQVMFCSWSSGAFLWPDSVASILNPLLRVGVDPKVPYALGGGTTSMSIGLRLLPATGDLDSSADGEREGTGTEEADKPNSVRLFNSGPHVSWDFQVDASPYGSSISVQYGRDVFGTASGTPLKTKWADSGNASDGEPSTITTHSNRGVRLEVQGTLGLDLSLGWTLKGTTQCGDFTRMGLGVGVQGTRGLVVSISWNRLGQTINIPVAVCPAEILGKEAVMWALAVPWASYIAVDYGIFRTRARRQRKEIRSERCKKLRKLVEKRRSEASQATTLMREQVERRQQRERDRGGLVILTAEYGVIQRRHQGSRIAQGEGLWRRGEVADVTVAVAALVYSGQLILPRRIVKVRSSDYHSKRVILTFTSLK